MCGGGRDPRAVAMSVAMKEAKGSPSPRLDPGARRALGRAKRLFLILRERLRQWREARKRTREDQTGLPEGMAAALASLGWGSTPMFSGSCAGGSSGGGPEQNTGPPPRSARSLAFGIVMTSFPRWMAGLGLATLVACSGGGSNPKPIPDPIPGTDYASIISLSGPSNPVPGKDDSLNISGNYQATGSFTLGINNPISGQNVSLDRIVVTLTSTTQPTATPLVIAKNGNGTNTINISADTQVAIAPTLPTTMAPYNQYNVIFTGNDTKNGAVNVTQTGLLTTPVTVTRTPHAVFVAGYNSIKVTGDSNNNATVNSGDSFGLDATMRAEWDDKSAEPTPIIGDVTVTGKATGSPDLTLALNGTGTYILEYGKNFTAPTLAQTSTYAFTAPVPLINTKANNIVETKNVNVQGSLTVNKPVVVVIATALKSGIYTAQNLDNGNIVIGPTGTLNAMDGDRIRYYSSDATGNLSPFEVMVTKNGAEDTSGSYGSRFIDGIVSTMGWTAMTGYDYETFSGDGTNKLPFDVTLKAYFPQGTPEKNSQITATTSARGPPLNGTSLTSYTFQTPGPTMDVKPAQDFVYTTSINPNIKANLDQVATVSSRFSNSGNGAYLTVDQWKTLYTMGQSGIDIQITKYDVDFTQNTLRLGLSDNTQLIYQTPNRKDVYDLQKAYTKTP